MCKNCPRKKFTCHFVACDELAEKLERLDCELRKAEGRTVYDFATDE